VKPNIIKNNVDWKDIICYQPHQKKPRHRSTGSPKTAEMKFMRRTAEYSLLDHRRTEDVLELGIHSAKRN
jgi:hypothetical protein